MRLKQPRIAPLSPGEWDDETREVLDGLKVDGRVYNVFATLARHLKLFKRWLVFGEHTFSRSSLPAREREMVILRMGWVCRAEYEWGHHVAIGKRVGLSSDDIRRIAAGPDAPGWDPFEAALLQAVDELHSDSFISHSTWKALAGRYSTEQLLDLIFTAGQYTLVSMALNCCGVQLEEGFEGFPDMG